MLTSATVLCHGGSEWQLALGQVSLWVLLLRIETPLSLLSIYLGQLLELSFLLLLAFLFRYTGIVYNYLQLRPSYHLKYPFQLLRLHFPCSEQVVEAPLNRPFVFGHFYKGPSFGCNIFSLSWRKDKILLYNEPDVLSKIPCGLGPGFSFESVGLQCKSVTGI